MQATRISAQAFSNWNRAASCLMFAPSASSEPPKYSPMIAPIMASTLATFSEVKRNGNEVGIRTSRKTASCPTAYDRISSSCSGFTDVRPRTTLTKTGKKQRTAATAIFELLFSGLNHAFVIGAKAMIGTAFAAMA